MRKDSHDVPGTKSVLSSIKIKCIRCLKSKRFNFFSNDNVFVTLNNFTCYFYIWESFLQLFYAGDRYHIETSPLTCSANQWTGFYMIAASVMKELSRNYYTENCTLKKKKIKKEECKLSIKIILFFILLK